MGSEYLGKWTSYLDMFTMTSALQTKWSNFLYKIKGVFRVLNLLILLIEKYTTESPGTASLKFWLPADLKSNLEPVLWRDGFLRVPSAPRPVGAWWGTYRESAGTWEPLCLSPQSLHTLQLAHVWPTRFLVWTSSCFLCCLMALLQLSCKAPDS